MANGFRGTVLPQIHRIFEAGTRVGMSDGELLDRFVTAGDADAFEALIARHGRLVLGVCRSMLRNPDDVEDAFQATLLVLVRKARSLCLDDSLGPWLYGVATRVARRARATAARRETREKCTDTLECPAPCSDLDRHDVSPILHEELTRLPDRLRDPLVLCYLQGLTHDQVSQQLRCPVGTIRSRLARGRELLRGRLSRRGVAVSAGAFATCRQEFAAAAIPIALFRTTVQAAMRVAAGQAMRGVVPAPVAALMKGVLSAMWISRLKTATAVSLVVGVIVTIAVSHSVQARDDRPAIPEVATAPADLAAPEADEAPKPTTYTISYTYYVGDLVTPPTGFVVRTGPNGERPGVDMGPMIELLTSTVAPGTWRVLDPAGNPMPGQDDKGQVGSITPFVLSLSLIARHSADTHAKIQTLLRQLRRIQDARFQGSVNTEANTASRPTAPTAAETNPTGAANRRVERTRKLLEELQREFDQLVRDADNRARFDSRYAPGQQ